MIECVQLRYVIVCESHKRGRRKHSIEVINSPIDVLDLSDPIQTLTILVSLIVLGEEFQCGEELRLRCDWRFQGVESHHSDTFELWEGRVDNSPGVQLVALCIQTPSIARPGSAAVVVSYLRGRSVSEKVLGTYTFSIIDSGSN